MAVPDSNAANNKFDIAETFYDGIDNMKEDGAPHDGSPAPRPAFEAQGSDANHGTSKRDTSLPPWIG
jgi:hypothetical protein